MEARSDALKFARVCSALGHEARLEIVRFLVSRHPEGAVVGEMKELLELPGSTLSHHLDLLRQEELVQITREGRFLRYQAAVSTLNGLVGFLLAECCVQGSASSEDGCC